MKKASLIPAGMTLAGDVEGDEDLVIHGRVEGDVRVGGAVVIEGDGVVRGDVQGRSVSVRGVVAGDAWAAELVRVDEGGRVVGDVTAPRVKVVEGARLRGRVHMGDDATTLPPEPRAGALHHAADTVTGTEAAPAPAAEPAAETAPETEPPASPRRPPAPRMPALGRRRGAFRARTG